MLVSRQSMPAKLPPPLPQPNVMFKSSRKQGFIGIEAADENVKDVCYTQRQAEHNAKSQRIENKAVS